MNSETPIPQLCAILVAGGQRERAARALASLLSQSAIDQMEIILMDLGPANLPPLAGSDHPRVRMERAEGEMLFARARAHALRMARAPAVAYIEEHCEAQPGWAETLIEAHRGPWAGVSCRFINGNPDSGYSNAAFHMTYGNYLPPRPTQGETTWMAGHNSSYKRDLLLSYGRGLDEMLKADVALHNKMLRDGHRFYFDGRAVIAHHNETTLLSVGAGVFDWNWCYMNLQARIFRWSLPRRVAHVALAPLIPWARLLRALVWSARLGRKELLQCLRDIPYFIAVSYCSAAGQAAGVLCDMSKAEARFSEVELNEPRPPRFELSQ